MTQSASQKAPQNKPALTVKGLTKTFDVSAPLLNRIIERKPRQFVQAVNDIDFSVPAGGCLSIVGESGCGKSTVARLVTGLFGQVPASFVSRQAARVNRCRHR